MDRRFARVAVQMLAFVGVALSVFMLVEYLVPDARSVCGPNGGCAGVHHSALGQMKLAGLFPVVPTLGVLAFLTLLVLSLSRAPWVQRSLPYVATVGAVVGATLIAEQAAVIHAWCKFCLVADTAAILAALFAWAGRSDGEPASRTSPWLIGAYAVGIVAAVAGSIAFHGAWRQPPIDAQVVVLPRVIVSEQRPGVATIVEFADFECPYCRRQHLELAQVIPGYGARVHFVRKQVPLHMHPHAEDAARAACCAEEQGHGEAVADALFRSEDLTPAGCEAIASRAGVDLGTYRACLHAPRIDARLQTDRDAATQSEVRGLPTMFIGNERFDGVVPAATVRQSIDHALQRASSGPTT